MAFRAGDGVDWGEAVMGWADAYQAEGKACILSVEKVPTQLALGMDNVSYLRGLAAWQRQLFRPSPHSHRIRDVLKEGVEICAQRTAGLHFFFAKSHAGMEVNTSADRWADWAAKLGEDR
eukprot:3550982-Rhodomonas_salina.1